MAASSTQRRRTSLWSPLAIVLLTILLLVSQQASAWTTVQRRSPLVRTQTRLWDSSNKFGDLESNAIGLNELHTLLRNAVAREDFLEAGRISDLLATRLYGDDLSAEEKRLRRKRMSWKGLGAAPWLTERLDSLNFTFPTTIQINAMEAVNAMLNATEDLVESTSLGERVDLVQKDMGVVVSGATGSGKTLAYMVPMLSTLSDSLFTRQRLRVGDEEMVGDTTGDLLDRVAIVTSPEVRSRDRKQVRKNTVATGAALSSLGKSGRDVKSPLALVVVPTRELGVQTAMTLFELIGGNVKDAPDEFSGKANMFRYKGPKGIKIACVLDEAELSYGLKLQTDIAVTMPEFVGKLVDENDVDPSKLRVVVYDEADLGLERTPQSALDALFNDDLDAREYTRVTYLVGASVTEALGNFAVSSRILPEGKSYIATATRFAALNSVEDARRLSEEDNHKTASLKDLNVCMYPGLKHERVVVDDKAGMLVLTRLLRKELKSYEETAKTADSDTAQRPRVVVFFPNEKEAKAAITPLRDAMWGEHKLCVLLPTIGENPLGMMEQFKNNETTVMIATPNSVRGLDFPALTHVYTLYLPIDDPREYVHLAGRVGRVGQLGASIGDGGHVVSVLSRSDASKMDALAESLGFEFTDIDASTGIPRDVDVDTADVEYMRRYLEDTLTLLDLAEDPAESDTIYPSEVVDVEVDEEEYEDDEEDAYQ